MRDDDSSGGNQVGALLCNLGTDLADPAQRLNVVSASMRGNKEVFADLPKIQQLALSAFNISPLLLELVPLLRAAAPPPFNIVISNVPGAREPLYWNGARLDGNYPLSIALDGQALNITLSNNADNLDFGLVGCRRSVPSLQRMLGHLEESLAELERATGVAAPANEAKTSGAKKAAAPRKRAAASTKPPAKAPPKN
jgi:diacylglycerol O-acyltransferase